VLLLILLTGAASAALAQGTIVFNNRVVGSVVAPVYMPDPANTTVYHTGNSPGGYPAGTTFYGGAGISGTGFTAQLWGSPGPNAPYSSLVPAVGYSTAGFRTGTAAGFWVSGTEAAVIPGATEGSVATLQVRVWANQGGTITSWAIAEAVDMTRGVSRLFNSLPLGGISAPPNLVGLESFNIVTLPEPSAVGIAVLIGAVVVCERS
jgi:hypothetical protein